MIHFRKMKWWERLLMCWPPYRREYTKRIKEAVLELVQHPEQPCMVENEFIPDGYGGVSRERRTRL